MQFDRTSSGGGPAQMSGYTVDADAATKLVYQDLRKISDDWLDVHEAKNSGLAMFGEQLQRAPQTVEDTRSEFDSMNYDETNDLRTLGDSG
jgi:hypothetical protein